MHTACCYKHTMHTGYYSRFPKIEPFNWILQSDNLPCSFQDRVKNAKIVNGDARSTAIDYPRNSSDLKSRCLQYGHICQSPPAHTQNKRLNFCPIGREFNSLGRGHYCQNHSACSVSAITEKEQKKI